MLFTHHNLCIKTCQCSYISHERQFLVYISHLHKHLLCIYFCHSHRREKMHYMTVVIITESSRKLPKATEIYRNLPKATEGYRKQAHMKMIN